MSNRKFRITETGGIVEHSPSDGQWMKCNYFCVNCHKISRFNNMHYPNCINKEIYSISSMAQSPKRYSNKRKWEIFKKQWVFIKSLHYDYINSWWYKNNKNGTI